MRMRVTVGKLQLRVTDCANAASSALSVFIRRRKMSEDHEVA